MPVGTVNVLLHLSLTSPRAVFTKHAFFVDSDTNGRIGFQTYFFALRLRASRDSALDTIQRKQLQGATNHREDTILQEIWFAIA